MFQKFDEKHWFWVFLGFLIVPSWVFYFYTVTTQVTPTYVQHVNTISRFHSGANTLLSRLLRVFVGKPWLYREDEIRFSYQVDTLFCRQFKLFISKPMFHLPSLVESQYFVQKRVKLVYSKASILLAALLLGLFWSQLLIVIDINPSMSVPQPSHRLRNDITHQLLNLYTI